MKLVVFGLTVSSSWGNGHATLWRGLLRELARTGHRVIFYERDQPFYARHRDLAELPGATLRLYGAWEDVEGEVVRELDDADVGLVTSYCPDARSACRRVLDADLAVRAFYDLDTPITLDLLARGEAVPWVPDEGLKPFDLVLSFTGGEALTQLRTRLGARHVVPLYGSVDPDVHRPLPPNEQADLTWLGTFAADRQDALARLLVEPARRAPHRMFLVGGAQYPADLDLPPNVRLREHVAPGDHGAFFASAPLTLSVTRAAMAALGWCPSGRLFEAAACGVPVLSDTWPGLEDFFVPGEEILIGHRAEDTLAALELGPDALARVGRRARERALADHTAARRAAELVLAVERASRHLEPAGG